MTIISSSLRCNISNIRAAPESVCHSLKKDDEMRRDREREELLLTSALTSSTSLVCDHTALLSDSH